MNAHDIANVLYVCVAAGLSDMQVVEPLLHAYPEKAAGQSPKESVRALWAAAALGHRDEVFLNVAKARLRRVVQGAGVGDCVRALWSFAKLELVGPVGGEERDWETVDTLF